MSRDPQISEQMKQLDLQPEASAGAAHFFLPEPIGLSFQIIRKIQDRIADSMYEEKR
jgi:hypothetical protein